MLLLLLLLCVSLRLADRRCLLQVLDDIFILRAVKGSDFFCIVSGLIDPRTVQEVRRNFAVRKAEARPSATPGTNLASSAAPALATQNPKQQLLQQSREAGNNSPSTSFFSRDPPAQTGASVAGTHSSSASSKSGGSADEDLSIENIYADKDF